MRQLEPREILETALYLLNGATTSLNITMQAKEELLNPTSEAYFRRLIERAHEGLLVTRIGFGTQEEFDRLFEKIHINSSHYSFHRTDEPDYQRMLLADEQKLMFARGTGTERKVLFTEEKSVVSEFLEYFRAHLLESYD